MGILLLVHTRKILQVFHIKCIVFAVFLELLFIELRVRVEFVVNLQFLEDIM